MLDDYRKTLKAFYGVLKSSDRYLRFVFLTGVTKFAQVSVFSDLNQLNDISMKPQYATICGITRQELEDTFIPELNRLAETNELTYEETLNKTYAKFICTVEDSANKGISKGYAAEIPRMLVPGKYTFEWKNKGLSQADAGLSQIIMLRK